MRKAVDKLKELYSTQLGQDVIETLGGAGIAAAGQALFTDMTPEEIAMSTGGGILAAAVGRPLVGRAGQHIGTRISNQYPGADRTSSQMINSLMNSQGDGMAHAAMKAKFAPYSHLNSTAQLGAILGRGYGDNIAQGAFALASPLLFTGEEDA